jgi:hypothetical protein
MARRGSLQHCHPCRRLAPPPLRSLAHATAVEEMGDLRTAMQAKIDARNDKENEVVKEVEGVKEVRSILQDDLDKLSKGSEELQRKHDEEMARMRAEHEVKSLYTSKVVHVSSLVTGLGD